MATASPSIGVIRAQIRAIRNKVPGSRVFGIFTSARWTGASVHGAGNDKIAVYQCDSPLQMRLALQTAPDAASATVLVTPLDQERSATTSSYGWRCGSCIRSTTGKSSGL